LLDVVAPGWHVMQAHSDETLVSIQIRNEDVTLQVKSDPERWRSDE